MCFHLFQTYFVDQTFEVILVILRCHYIRMNQIKVKYEKSLTDINNNTFRKESLLQSFNVNKRHIFLGLSLYGTDSFLSISYIHILSIIPTSIGF